jgi:hypothetical protein
LHDRVTAAADHELRVGPRGHLALGASRQHGGVARTEHQLPGVYPDLGFSLDQMPDLLGVKDVRRALLAGAHLDQPHAEFCGRAL